AGRDLRALLDLLESAAPATTLRPLEIPLASSQRIRVTTFHYDLARTGWNARESILTPSNVTKSGFGRLWYTPVDEQVYASPLVVNGQKENSKIRVLVIDPTENNTVYALDADTGSILWQKHLATPLTGVEYNDCLNINPLHGITSTPVIDL